MPLDCPIRLYTVIYYDASETSGQRRRKFCQRRDFVGGPAIAWPIGGRRWCSGCVENVPSRSDCRLELSGGSGICCAAGDLPANIEADEERGGGDAFGVVADDESDRSSVVQAAHERPRSCTRLRQSASGGDCGGGFVFRKSKLRGDCSSILI
nr:hypothetical protein Iba_scaffold570CG0230 [Ipomoea batatas]